jgi:hypothetical protein
MRRPKLQRRVALLETEPEAPAPPRPRRARAIRSFVAAGAQLPSGFTAPGVTLVNVGDEFDAEHLIVKNYPDAFEEAAGCEHE